MLPPEIVRNALNQGDVSKKYNLSPRHQQCRFLKTAPVTTLRSLLARHRWLAIWLVSAALMMKVLVPAGFMPNVSSGAILVQLCSGQGLQTVMMEIPGRSGDHDPADHKQADIPCAFSGLSSPALAAADPILLALAIAFILAMGFLGLSFAPPAPSPFLRPPPIGPPTAA